MIKRMRGLPEKATSKAAAILAGTVLALGTSACGKSEKVRITPDVNAAAAKFGRIALAHKEEAQLVSDPTVKGSRGFQFKRSVEIEGSVRTDLVNIFMAPPSIGGQEQVYNIGDIHESCPVQSKECPSYSTGMVITDRGFLLGQSGDTNGDWAGSIAGKSFSPANQSSSIETNRVISTINFDLSSLVSHTR